MKNPSKRTLTVLLLISLAYFCAFIFPNNLGAKNVNMLAVFEIDEYAQYPAVESMLSGGDSLKQIVRNFLVYGHYFYGYPFFFISGIVLSPMRVIVGPDWSLHTQLNMLLLRQLVNVLPNLLSAMLLTFYVTHLQSLWKSALIFCILLITPALVNNGFWWHPDGIGLLMVALVLVCLQLDDLHFGRFFILAAISAGIAAGIKYLGLFFFLSIPAYLLVGVYRKAITWREAIFKSLLFVGIMLLALVVTNPLLLLQERIELVSTQTRQFSRTSMGELIGKQPFLEDGRLPSWLNAQYGSWPFMLLGLAGLAVGLKQRESRINALLMTLFILPLAAVIMRGALQRPHYWLPVFLPLSASIAYILPDNLPRRIKITRDGLTLLILMGIFFQVFVFMDANLKRLDQMLHREQQSPSLSFYQLVKKQIVEPIKVDQPLRIYRDWRVYFPSDEAVDAFMNWDLASYDLINDANPDLLLLERENVRLYGQEDFLEKSADATRLAPMHHFYADALQDQIRGYQQIYKDEFGLVFKRNDIFQSEK